MRTTAASETAGPHADRPGGRAIFVRIVLLCLGIRVLLEGLGLISLAAHDQPLSRGLQMWSQWDAPHYLRIAEVGYRPHTVSGDDPLFIVFFPFFPLAVKILTLVFRDLIVSGLLVSLAASIGAGWFLHKVVSIDSDDGEAWRAVVLLFAFPTAYFLSAPYSEALFLFAAVACIYAGRTERWPYAGLGGALATGTRVVGVALLPALLVEARGKWKRYAWIAVAAIGLFVYLGINLVVHDDPLWFLHIQRTHWYQHAVPPWQSITDAIVTLRSGALEPTRNFIMIGRLVGFVAGAGLLGAGIRHLRLADSVYAWSGFVLMLSTSWLLSLPRYLIVLYPIFIVGARLTRNRVAFSVVLVASIATQGWLFWRYAVGAWSF